MTVYSAALGGEIALVEQGPDSQPRTTTNGAVLSVRISGDRNSTFARAVRMGKKVFISRDGTNRPLYPTV